MSEAFKQPPTQLPPMYLFVSPVLPSVFPRTPVLITFLFVFLINALFILYAWHVLLEIVCKPLALFVWGFLLKNYLPPWCWQRLILWLWLDCEYFWMHLYLGADFAKYLFGSACAETNVVLLNIVTCHLFARLCYFITCHSLVIFGCEFCRAGTRPFLAFGIFFLFHLIGFYWYITSENQRKMLCCLSALVPQGLCEVHWWQF